MALEPISPHAKPVVMAARIVSLGRRHAVPGSPGPGVAERARERYSPRPEGRPQTHVWRGASGREYVHGVYSLIGCPPLPKANYVLVRRDADGRRHALRAGVVGSDAPTLNLALLRREGARAGADEVHVCLAAASDPERRLMACDLRAGLFGTLAASAQD